MGELALSLCGAWCARTQEKRGPVPPPAPGMLPQAFWEMATGLPLRHGRTLVVFTLLPLLQLQPERSGRTLHSSPSRQGSIWHHHFCSTMEAGTRGAVSAAWFGLTAWGDGLGVPWDTRPHTAQPAGPGPVWVRPCRSRILWVWTV